MTATASSDGPACADAELIAVARACAEAARERDAAAEAAQTAEASRAPLAPPAAIIKTQRDAELGLFDGCGVGTPYLKAEVDLLRPLAERRSEAAAASPVHARSSEIVAAWPAWRAALADYAADPRLDAAVERHEDLLSRLLDMPAVTLDGIVAKARAFDSLFRDDAALARCAENDFEAFGPNETVLARALARDLIRLARAAAPSDGETAPERPRR